MPSFIVLIRNTCEPSCGMPIFSQRIRIGMSPTSGHRYRTFCRSGTLYSPRNGVPVDSAFACARANQVLPTPLHEPRAHTPCGRKRSIRILMSPFSNSHKARNDLCQSGGRVQLLAA